MNAYQTPSKRRARIVGSVVAAPLLAVAAHAQEAAPAAKEEVVELTPFQVTESQDAGYAASNSIAGTRTATPIRDIPLNIQVFTKDLADDFAVNSHVELERYNASLVNGGADSRSTNTIQQSYNAFIFRGFIQNWSLRDGVRQYDPIDTAGISRVELVKGPAAPLYGLTYPGGVMNMVSKSVDFNKNFTDIRLTGQRYGEYRSSIDANYSGKVGSEGRFGVRVNGVYSKTKDDRDNSDGQSQFLQVNLGFRPIKGTEIAFLAEKGFREKPNGLGYFSRGETDGNGVPLNNGADIPLQVAHPNIPWSYNWSTGNMRDINAYLYKGTITQQIGDDLTIQAYWQTGDRVQVDSQGYDGSGGGGSAASWDMGWSSQGGIPTGWLTLPNGQEVIRMHYHHRDWQNNMHAYGATAVYKVSFAGVKNTFTAGAAAWAERFKTYKWTQPGTTTNYIDFPVSTSANLTVPWAPPPDYFADVAGAYGRERNSNDYYFVSWQGSTLENRLKGNVAFNRTNLKLIQWANGLSSTANVTDASKTSPLFGISYDITKDITAFAVHSTSLFPTTDKNDFDVQMPPVTGKSNEIGVKVELLDKKISGTVSYYEIEQKGGAQRDPNAVNRNKLLWDSLTDAQRAQQFPGRTRSELTDRGGSAGDLVPGQKAKSKGFEADLVFQPVRELQVLLSYAHNTAKVTESKTAGQVGRIATQGHIKDQASLLAKYSVLSGPGKGLSFGGGLQYAGKAFQDYSGPGGAARYNPSTMYLETFAGYRFKALGYDHLIQLNIKNITRQEEFVGWKATGSSSKIATERYEVDTPIIWSVTYGLSF